MSALKNALKFLELGVPILPLETLTDIPLASSQFPVASSGDKKMRSYFKKNTSCNYGVAPGPGFCIVRASGPAGKEVFEKFASSNEGKFPKTVAWRYAGDLYRLFRCNDDITPSSTSLSKGLDLLGPDQFVPGPGSKLADGRKIRFFKKRGVGEIEIADAPIWLPMNEIGRVWSVKSVVPIPIDKITVREDYHRDLRPDHVKALAASMMEIGLQNPIAVTRFNGIYQLERGHHRFEAAKKLGWSLIDGIVQAGDPLRTEKANLDDDRVRRELSVLEWALNLKCRILPILEAEKVTQVARPGGKQPNDKGIGRAARKLGLNRDEVRRMLQIASISTKAQIVAKELGLDNIQAALLEIAEQPNAKKQIATAQEIARLKTEAPSKKRNAAAKGKASAKVTSEESEPPENSESTSEDKGENEDDNGDLDLEDDERTDTANHASSPVEDDDGEGNSDEGADIPPFLNCRPFLAEEQKLFDAALAVFRDDIQPLLASNQLVATRWLNEITRLLDLVPG